MLGTRVLTAAVLLVVLVGIAWFAPPAAFDLLLLLIVALALYEWLRLIALNTVATLVTVLAFIALCGGTLFTVPAVMATSHGLGADILVPYVVVTVLWLVFVPRALHRFMPLSGKGWPAGVVAFVMCLAAWLALIQADGMGKMFLLSVLLVVWVSDTAAYFAGRAFGRRKLAPSISPGKTWEGVIGALIANIGLAIGFVVASDNRLLAPGGNLFSMLQITQGWFFMMAVTILLTLLGVIGDLYESLIKRIAGVKDSGRLLPGHGGVYDRIDALLAVFPVAMCIVTLIQTDIF